MSEPISTLTAVMAVFALALGVRLLVANREGLSYASVLVAVGLLVSVLGLSFDLELTADLILAVFLPAIVFEGTTALDVRRLWRNLPVVGVLVVVGLPLSVAVLGAIGTVAFGFPTLVALIFAAVILPTDPAAVLSLFEEFEVSERLAVTIEGESLLNDGVAIVVFSSLVGTYESAAGVTSLATPSSLAGLAAEIAVVGGGGLALGCAVGYIAHMLVRRLDDEMAVLLLTVLVAYGSFLLAEHYLGLSGVLAVVGAGLLMGAHEETHRRMSESESNVQHLWETVGFLASTVLYILIGAEVRPADFLRHADLVVGAAILVVVVRGLAVYPLVSAANRAIETPVPRYCQHIMVWGGLHTVVPVALALSLPAGLPFRGELQTMVFGVAVISLLVQGLLMPPVLEAVGVGDADA